MFCESNARERVSRDGRCAVKRCWAARQPFGVRRARLIPALLDPHLHGVAAILFLHPNRTRARTHAGVGHTTTRGKKKINNNYTSFFALIRVVLRAGVGARISFLYTHVPYIYTFFFFSFSTLYVRVITQQYYYNYL